MTLKPHNLHVTNTLTRRREKFEPLAPPHVGMYVCGPTVYGDAHLGHAKSYISFDVIVRYLRHLGYDVTYVQNITDVGHLTDDADSGEDKVEKAARAKKVHPMQIAEQFTRRYFEDMDALNILRPDISPRASGHMPEQIEHVKKLIERGHAYEANGSVYFDVASWANYGRLSGRSVEEMQAGARVEVSAEKRHPADFALWKRAEPGHILQWPSPWGMGYPGWHIECSAMSMKYLGETFDIHGGGIENVFPHHEDEIAQAEAATPGAPGFVKYWLHNNMVTVAGKKMGKSLGNFLTLRDAFAKWPPMVIRLFILQSHYRSPTDFSEEALEAAAQGFNRFRTVMRGAEQVLETLKPSVNSDVNLEPSDVQALEETRVRFLQAMDEDFNTPGALSVLFDAVRKTNVRMAEAVADYNIAHRATILNGLESYIGLLKEFGGHILGLRLDTVTPAETGTMDRVVQILIDERTEARKAKDFKRADAIRDRLAEAGILLEDTPDGTTWRFK